MDKETFISGLMKWLGSDYPPPLNKKKTGRDLQKMDFRHWATSCGGQSFLKEGKQIR